jgi:DNA-binding CsgD family transcriptional regulator
MAQHRGPPLVLEKARQSYDRRAWDDAYEAFVAAAARGPLDLDDIERLSRSAALTAREDEFIQWMERLHQAAVDAGALERGAYAAFWCGFRLLTLGEMGRGSAWLGRAQQIVERDLGASRIRGYLQLPKALRYLMTEQPGDACAAIDEAIAIAERFGDEDLMALGHYMRGRCFVQTGRVDAALPALDRAMLSVSTGGVSAIVTGIVYCGVIANCQRIFALERCREWTAALANWCASQPQLVSFGASCRVHRAEVLALEGDWDHAIAEALEVTRSAQRRGEDDAQANAFYEQGEIHRLRGDLDAAEAAYTQASAHGREPQPGLGLLRVAQGRLEDGLAGVRRAVTSTRAPLARARYLPALVEILLAAGRIDEAREAAEELARAARDLGVDLLGAMAAHAMGAVLLAEGNAEAALEPLRRALGAWRDVGAPYITARIRILIGQAFGALGDRDGAQLELQAARDVFDRLGARLDLERLDPAAGSAARAEAPAAAAGLTPREHEVLRLIATGKTNKAIARELCLSEKTIDRHVSNIFSKISVTSRAGATAYAYENKLV